MSTEYVVLELIEEGSWREMREVRAHSADQAIRFALDPDGHYVAIPSQKWHYRSPRDLAAGRTSDGS